LANTLMQGHTWRTGFQNHELQGVVFDDVPEALARWHASGIKVSSGFSLLQVFALFSRVAVSILFCMCCCNNTILLLILCGTFVAQ